MGEIFAGGGNLPAVGVQRCADLADPLHQAEQLLAAGIERADQLTDFIAAARFEVRRQVAVRQLAHSQDERAEPAQVRQVKARDEVDGEQQRQQRQAEQPIAM
jgi:hypothetical protein